MDKSESSLTDASTESKNTTTQRQRINIHTVQNMLLIWLTDKIDESSTDCWNIINQLRMTGNEIEIFTDPEECFNFIDIIDDTKVCLVISSSLAELFVSCIHDMSKVDSIFIFCNNKMYHKQWPKIKVVSTEITSICEALKEAVQQCEQNSMSMSFIATDGDNISKKNLDQLDRIFIYSQILKEILLTIQFDDEHLKEFIDYCRELFADNDKQLRNIDKLETKYYQKTPIWWYTSEMFLYPMLNRCLRLMNMNIIMKMGFFITDLHRQIEKLHREQFGGDNPKESFVVYRGQGMSKTDFEYMRHIQGGLMSFHNFLLTSKASEVSFSFAESSSTNPDLIGILFVMLINPKQSTTPFASIIDTGYFGDQKDELLFSTHSIFRIGEIKPIGENQRLFQVNLTLANDNDKDLRYLIDHIREKIYANENGWYRLGLLLLDLGEFAKALQVYETLQEQTHDMNEKAKIYIDLGRIKCYQGEYEKSIIFYEKALEIFQNILSPTHLNLTICYDHIGTVYLNMGNYPTALSYYKKACEIKKQSLSSNHPDLAHSYNNIGAVYDKMGNSPKALSYYEKVLEIQKQFLPSDHPDLASSYNNIGLMDFNTGDYSNALSSYEKALEIQIRLLPPNHPDLIDLYNSIGAVYSKMNDYSKALSSYENALEIQQQSLPSNHPQLAHSYNNISWRYSNMGDYPNALSSLGKALEIQKQLLPSNHPQLAYFYNNIGLVYSNMGDYPKALSSLEKAFAIKRQSLPSNHPELAYYYNNIGLVYSNMDDHRKALSYYEKALEIQKQSLPSDHPDLASTYNNIGLTYSEMSNSSIALLFHEKALEIRKQSIPANHPELAYSYNNVGNMYTNMGDYPKALSFLEKALVIKIQLFPSNHPDLTSSYNNIGNMYSHMGHYPKALSYYEKALEIQKQSFHSTHPDLALIYNNIGDVYDEMGEYSKARAFYERAVEIGKQSLPANHSLLQLYKSNVETVKKKL